MRSAIGSRPIKVAVLPGDGFGGNPKAYAAAC